MAYFGKMEGWTLRPPYSALLRIRGGTKRPNETATMRFIGSSWGFGNCPQSASRSIIDLILLTSQPINVSLS